MIVPSYEVLHGHFIAYGVKQPKPFSIRVRSKGSLEDAKRELKKIIPKMQLLSKDSDLAFAYHDNNGDLQRQDG